VVEKQGQAFQTSKINEILSEHPDNANYGYDRIHKALEIRGIKVSRNTVYRAMKDGNLIHKARKPHGITKASTEIQDKENLIKRDFTADKPVKKLLTDITEVQCLDGKLYISPIMDCYNGEILTVEMRDNMKKELCIDISVRLRGALASHTASNVFNSFLSKPSNLFARKLSSSASTKSVTSRFNAT